MRRADGQLFEPHVDDLTSFERRRSTRRRVVPWVCHETDGCEGRPWRQMDAEASALEEQTGKVVRLIYCPECAKVDRRGPLDRRRRRLSSWNHRLGDILHVLEVRLQAAEGDKVPRPWAIILELERRIQALELQLEERRAGPDSRRLAPQLDRTQGNRRAPRIDRRRRP